MSVRKRRAGLALAVVIGVTVTLFPAISAQGSHSRPGSATPIRAALVPSYKTCTAPDSQHVGPLALQSCTTANPQFGLNSSIIAMGTGAFGVSGFGVLEIHVICRDDIGQVYAPPCQLAFNGLLDVYMEWNGTDLRCRGVNTMGSNQCAVAGADYEGHWFVRAQFRVTDHSSGQMTCTFPSGGAPCYTGTTIDFPYSVVDNEWPGTSDCAATAQTAAGGICQTENWLNFQAQGTIKSSQRSIFEILDVRVLDAGTDGELGPYCPPVCGTGDEGTVLEQGLYTP